MENKIVHPKLGEFIKVLKVAHESFKKCVKRYIWDLLLTKR